MARHEHPFKSAIDQPQDLGGYRDLPAAGLGADVRVPNVVQVNGPLIGANQSDVTLLA